MKFVWWKKIWRLNDTRTHAAHVFAICDSSASAVYTRCVLRDSEDGIHIQCRDGGMNGTAYVAIHAVSCTLTPGNRCFLYRSPRCMFFSCIPNIEIFSADCVAVFYIENLIARITCFHDYSTTTTYQHAYYCHPHRTLTTHNLNSFSFKSNPIPITRKE